MRFKILKYRLALNQNQTCYCVGHTICLKFRPHGFPEQNNFGLELILYYFSRAESCQTLAIFNLDPFSNAQRLIFLFRKKKIHFWRTSISGAAIAQWILLYLLCYPGFESQAHHLCFNFFVEFVLYWSCEKNGIKQKGPGLAHLKSQFLLKLYNLWAATLIIFWVFWN